MENLFDIRSGRWIKALRVITILIAIAFIIAGFVIGVRDANGEGKDRLYFEDAEFFEFVVWFLAGILASVVYTVASMALIQLLDNVETLRKKFDSDSVAANEKSPVECVSKLSNKKHIPGSYNNEHEKPCNCEFCGKKDVEVLYCKIVDSMGTRYRNLCADCMHKHHATPISPSKK